MTASPPSRTAGNGQTLNGLSHALIDAELEQIAASATFRRSARHVRFLRHLVACKLVGDTGRLREIALGVDVFHRRAERFDPRQDTIVRVEARRLRQKLARYYAEEGQDARLDFVLPVGTYEIEIRKRSAGESMERQRASVAVLDIVNASGASGNHALAAGLGYELTSALARLNGLRIVAARAAAAPAPDADWRARVSGLKVFGAVTGELVSRDGRLWLGLRLVRVEDGALLWSREVTLTPDSAADQLELLARAIVTTLHREAQRRQLERIRLSGTEPLVRGRANGDVRERLDLARISMRQNTIDGFRKAEALAEEAIALAPDHAPAYVLLAQALIASVGMTVTPSLPAMESARLAAQRAVELDHELADAHGELGTIRFCFDRDWAGAETSMLRALRFAPAIATSHARYGWALMMNRRFDEARSEYAEAIELDPLSLLYRTHRALIELYARDFASARRGLEQVLEIAPDHLVARALLAALCLYEGKIDEGKRRYQEIAERFPRLSIGRCGLAQSYALLEDDAAARRELAWLHKASDAGYVSPYQLAMVYARLDDAGAAVDWLDRAAQSHDFNLVCVAVDPAFDPLRPVASFRDLLRGKGFAHLLETTSDPE